MKDNVKAGALHEAELAKGLSDGQEQMFRLRFQLSMGQSDGLKKLRQLRKDRARLLTEQRKRELDKAAGKPAVEAAAAVPKIYKAKQAAAAKPAIKKTAAKKTQPVKA